MAKSATTSSETQSFLVCGTRLKDVRQGVQTGDDGRNRCSDGTSRNLFLKRTPACPDELNYRMCQMSFRLVTMEALAGVIKNHVA